MMLLSDFINRYHEEFGVAKITIYYTVRKNADELIKKGIIEPKLKMQTYVYEVKNERKLYDFISKIREKALQKHAERNKALAKALAGT